MKYRMRLVEFHHVDNTKSYTLFQIEREDGEAALIKRWSKIGLVGQVKVEFGPKHLIEALFGAALKERDQRKYKVTQDLGWRENQDVIATMSNHKIINKIGSDTIAFLSKSIPVDDLPPEPPPQTMHNHHIDDPEWGTW